MLFLKDPIFLVIDPVICIDCETSAYRVSRLMRLSDTKLPQEQAEFLRNSMHKLCQRNGQIIIELKAPPQMPTNGTVLKTKATIAWCVSPLKLCPTIIQLHGSAHRDAQLGLPNDHCIKRLSHPLLRTLHQPTPWNTIFTKTLPQV